MHNLKALIVLLLFHFVNITLGQVKTEIFDFVHEGNKLNGVLDLPAEQDPTALIIIIQGYGKSNIVAGNGYLELRSFFVDNGLAVYTWDKPGCGKSEGKFDINQPVQNSAKEALAAIKELKLKKVPGSDKIGLWGISRAGWICPLIINENQSINFWISVSGVDDKENFPYLLETNLRIEGRSEEQIALLLSEYNIGFKIFRSGGSFEDYQKSRINLEKDPFWKWMIGDNFDTKESYQEKQEQYKNENHIFDEATELEVYLPNFKKILNKIECPVLAIFGEKDGNVDWLKTRGLYKETIGSNSKAKLSIKSFPNCNHNIIKCETGGYREKIQKWTHCDGYFDTMALWLNENGFGK